MGSRGRVGIFGVGVCVLSAVAPCAFGQTRVSSEKGSAVRGPDPARSVDSINTAAAPSVSTDYADYAPGDTVVITGSGFDANDTITLLVAHSDGTPVGGAGHDPFAVISDESGNFSATWFVDPDDSGGSVFLLTADCAHGLHAETTFTDTIPGHGVVTSVTPTDGGCVSVGANSSLTTWEVQPGKTYTVIIEGVDDAANSGTDATMLFFLQNTVTGNLCLTGQQVSAGVYSLQITIPVHSCETSPINYGVCDGATAKRARGNAADAVPSTTTNGVHLRANTDCMATGSISCSSVEACCEDGGICNDRTISNCLNTTAGHGAGTPMGPGSTCATTTCGGRREDCTIQCANEFIADCNGPTDPSATGSAICSGTCTASSSDGSVGGICPQEETITRTWTCTSPDGGESASCEQTIHVVDTTPPVVTCPADCEVECGEAICITPLCNLESCACGGEPSCTDDCGDCSISSTCLFIQDGCPTVVAGVTPPPKTGTLQKTFSGSDGISTVAGSGGCPNTASCTQTIKIVDTTAPEILCSDNITVQAHTGECCSTVSFGTSSSDTCDDSLTVECSTPSGSCFGVGTTEVNCSATDDCTNSSGCQFSITVQTSICGSKKYDADGDGVGETGIAGWKVVLSGDAGATAHTDASGNYCFNGLAAGNYTATEVAPNSSWLNTSPTSCSFPELTCPGSCAFNNVCLGAGGGLTLGYWSNKNGLTRMNDGGTMAPELAQLTALCLRNANGSDFDPTSYSAFKGWLLKATSTNMAYMLSAQLSAMTLNVESGNVAGGSIIDAPGCGGFVSVNDVMAAANAALCADGNTPFGDPNRAVQECLKNALDRGNNNLNFVQSAACPFAPY